MQFDDLLSQVLALLQREERVSYRSIKLRFGIDDDYMEGLKDELIYAKKLAADEDSRVLVWTGEADTTSTASSTSSISIPAASHTTEPEREPLSYTPAYLAEKILTAKSGLEGERKQVTVLFCDLQNSTPLAEKIGPENMHSLLNRFFELALSEVHRYEGTINQFLGDGFMALFGAPISHEDHARRGALAALALQRALKGADLGKPYGVECAFRMGLNSGLVVVGSIGDNLRMDYSAIGDTTNLASRLQQQADPGDILINETTARLVQGYIRLEALVPVEVRGKTEPVSMYKVVGILPRRSPIATRSERTLSQFVGRERELAQAIPILEQAVQEADQYRSRQVQSIFRTYLGEAYHLDDQIEKASGLAYQGLELAEAIKFPWGMGRAQRILGCIALTNGHLAEAEFYLQHALEILASIHACFEQARTHLDFAALAHTQGHQDTATTHLSTAYAWFQKLQIPKWMERTEQRAHEYGVTLTEVELEEFETEDSP